MALIWKNKFDEMFKITNSLMAENQNLQKKIKLKTKQNLFGGENFSQTTKTSGSMR